MTLIYKAFIQASPKDIWTLLTSPEGTAQIFYGAQVQSTFEPGAPIVYIGPGRDGEHTVHIHGHIESCVPEKLLSHTNIVGAAYASNADKMASRITYCLEDAVFATKLTICHDQWQPGDPSYENTKENWWLMLSNIKTLAETGAPLNIGTHE